MATSKAKTVYVSKIRKGRTTIYAGTLEELKTNVFGYTLECGNSWNKKISRDPKSVTALVNNLNKSVEETQGGCFNQDSYYVSNKEEYDAYNAPKPSTNVPEPVVETAEPEVNGTSEELITTSVDPIKFMEEIFNEQQIEVIKATVTNGLWGDTDTEIGGEEVSAFGYCTSEAKKTLPNLTNRQIAGIYSGIAKIIKAKKVDFMVHIPDYWGEGKTSDGMLLFKREICEAVETWAGKKASKAQKAKAPKAPKPVVEEKPEASKPKTGSLHIIGDIHSNGKWIWTEYKPGKFDWRNIKVK